MTTSENTEISAWPPDHSDAGTSPSQPAPCVTSSPICASATPSPTILRSHSRFGSDRERLQPRHVARQPLDEGDELAAEDRHDSSMQEHEAEHDDADDDQRRDQRG